MSFPIVRRFRQIHDAQHQSWERKCSRCGLCCHEKTISGKDVTYDLSSWCEHYDPLTKSCRIYHERFSRQVRCRSVNPLRAMFSSYLPHSCGYVQWARSKHLRFAPYRRIHYIGGDPDPEDPAVDEYMNRQLMELDG